MEERKDVKGYEGLYRVSNQGRVYSLRKKEMKWLRIKSRNKPYLKVDLHKGKWEKTYYVHRLVAMEFVPNPDGKPFINHKDGDHKNNKAENLERCTASENNHHKYKVLKGGTKRKTLANTLGQKSE